MQRIDHTLDRLLGHTGRMLAGAAAGIGVFGVALTGFLQPIGFPVLLCMAAPGMFVLLVLRRLLRQRWNRASGEPTWMFGTTGEIVRTRILVAVLRGLTLLLMVLACSCLVLPAVLVCAALAVRPWRWIRRHGSETVTSSTTSAQQWR